MVKFIPMYFIICIAIVAFFISFSDSLSLVYRNTTDFCMLILYAAAFLNLLISSNNFGVDSLGFSIYKIISSTNRDNFTSFFPIQMPYVSFSCLIAFTRTSVIMLNRNGESECPCLVPDLKGKAFNLS